MKTATSTQEATQPSVHLRVPECPCVSWGVSASPGIGMGALSASFMDEAWAGSHAPVSSGEGMGSEASQCAGSSGEGIGGNSALASAAAVDATCSG